MNNPIAESEDNILNNDIQFPIGKKEIINLLNNNWDYEEIKRIIEMKVDSFISNKYGNDLAKRFEEKINDLLEIQEKLFVKKEIIKQKIIALENYLNSLNKEE